MGWWSGGGSGPCPNAPRPSTALVMPCLSARGPELTSNTPFAGKQAVKALLTPEFAKLKGAPKLTTADEATAFLHTCIPFTFFLRVARANASPHKILQITPQQLFVPDEYYAWFLDPNPIKGLLMAGAMVGVVLAGVMFPLWPLKMRIAVWYLSMGVLGLIGLFFATAVVRLIVWCITVVVLKPGIWIFPNLFADVGFVSHNSLQGAIPVPNSRAASVRIASHAAVR